MIQLTLKGLVALQTAIKEDQKATDKALSSALKVEGFNLAKQLKSEIRSGSPGGKQFKPLTFLARRKARSTRPNKPLQRLALPIRYNMVNPLTVAVGWTGPKVDASWKKIAERQQQGFTSTVTDPRRRFFFHKADNLGRRSPNRKFLFLRDETTTLETKPRPIIEPFYKAHHIDAWKHIRDNFKKKMKGEKI